MGQAARELDECYNGMVISAGTGEEDGESGEDGEGAAEGEEDLAVYQIRIDGTTADRDDENGYGVSIHGRLRQPHIMQFRRSAARRNKARRRCWVRAV